MGESEGLIRELLRALKIARCNGEFDDPSFGEVIDEAIAKAEEALSPNAKALPT